MKHTKNLLFILLASTILLTSLSGCKKGEGDPFLSLHSRKARVAGEWTYSQMEEKSDYTSSSNYSGSTFSSSGNYSTNLNGTTITASGNEMYQTPFGPVSTLINGTGSATYSINIEKDGTFKRTVEWKNLVLNITEDGDTETMTINTNMESTGTWNFLGGMEEDFKNKERIILNILQEKVTSNMSDSDGYETTDNDTYTYSNGRYNEVWHINTLKNKEMIIDAEMNRTGSSTSLQKYSGSSSNSSYTSNETGTVSATLEQK